MQTLELQYIFYNWAVVVPVKYEQDSKAIDMVTALRFILNTNLRTRL